MHHLAARASRLAEKVAATVLFLAGAVLAKKSNCASVRRLFGAEGPTQTGGAVVSPASCYFSLNRWINVHSCSFAALTRLR